MTMTHPVIASMRDERDTEQPTVEAPALDTWVVENGDVMDAQYLRAVPHGCHCPDRRHRDERDREAISPNGWLPDGAHPITVHLYAVIVEETHPSMSRDGNRDLRGDEINRIRQDLDKRAAADVAKAERRAANAAAKDSAIRSGGDEKDRKGLFGTIFGGKK